jgi:hypothetical protein
MGQNNRRKKQRRSGITSHHAKSYFTSQELRNGDRRKRSNQ